MKKFGSFFLCLCMLFLSIPISANAISSDTEVVETHGSETYMGLYSDWEDTWDSSNFTDVTGEDIDVSENLVIKSGKVGSVTVSDSCDLTISGGTVSDVSSDGTIDMTGGKAESLQSSEDISVSGGTVSGDIDSDKDVTLSGSAAVKGDVSGLSVTVNAMGSSSTTSVSGSISFTDNMILEGTKYSIGKIDGQSSGTLEFESFNGTMPNISDVNEILVDSNSTVSASADIDVDTLVLNDGSKFADSSDLTIGKITGSGILIFNAGKLTVNTGISGSPVFDLNGTASSGVTAFKAASDTVSTGDVTIFGYDLTKQTYSSSYDSFTLSPKTGNGVTLSTSSLSVAGGSYGTVTATVSPALSQLTSGTQLCWKLIDPSSQFSISPNSSNNTCSVSASNSSNTYKATLAAYLADSSGNILSDYKTAVCTLTSTPASNSSSSYTSSNSNLALDTKTVQISAGHKYYVLAITSEKTPPLQTSYNSAVAVTGKATAYSYNGKVGWLYPITAKARGGVTIKIGSQTVLVTVI